MTVDCTVTPTQITVGDRVTLKCQLPAPAGEKIEFDTTQAEQHEFVVLEFPRVEQNSLIVTLTSYKVGPRELSKLRIKNSSEEIWEVRGESIQVQSVLKQESGAQPTPYDIIPPGGIPYPLWWWILWGMVGAIILGFVIRALWKWRKTKALEKAMAKQGPPLTAREKYEQALRRLESRGLHNKGEFKAFALELTGIVKKSLQEERKFRAEDMTSEEMFDHLKRKEKSLWNATATDLTVLFTELDKIKFAKIQVHAEDCRKLLEVSSRFGRHLFPGAMP